MGACIEIFFSEEMGESRACIKYIFDEYKLYRQCFNHQLLLRSYSSFYVSLCVCLCVCKIKGGIKLDLLISTKHTNV